LHPSDIDGLIRRAREEDELPFWAYLWPASIGIARCLCSEDEPSLPIARCLPPTVLELGCGVGLAGIVAATLGMNVIQTDLVPNALRFARVNARRNGVEIPGFVGDWRAMGLNGRFDVILGSDVLYEPKLHPALMRIMHNHLAPEGRVLISDPCRVYALQFMALLEDKGWRVSVQDAPAFPADDTSVLIYSATPPPTGREMTTGESHDSTER
ncbi:MAG: methyltransferase domain-containing protein, partial [Armatimonadetes bacterium]|nr:methyltransferase domain-containing protein [Armatimonadota bacterium]